MKCFLIVLALLISSAIFSQTTYEDSLRTYLKNYVQNHEVVKGHDKDHMQFYEVDKAYKVAADFKPVTSANWLSFKTSGTKNQLYKLYGTLSFNLHNKPYQLNIYQSQDLMTIETYKNYLFLPFSDSTSGNETYISGRYLELSIADIKNNKVVLDFNKAYNPYCAYVSGVYNCPIPPKENALAVAVKAGEKNFSNSH
jgi:uncharacterized protein (DUF1684 family)